MKNKNAPKIVEALNVLARMFLFIFQWNSWNIWA